MDAKTIKFRFYMLSFTMAILLIAIDQLTKLLAEMNIRGYEGIPLIEGVLEFLFISNTGGAFSLLSGNTWIFLIITPVVLVLIIILFIKIPFSKRFLPLKISFIFLFAGAVGNFIDRVALGSVRDFIYIKLINFPIFNVADIYVTLSLIFILILIVFKYKDSDLKQIFDRKRSGDE